MPYSTPTKEYIIKMLFLDDFLYSEKSLEQITENFDLHKDRWLVTACVHSRKWH